ncbi:hypothetical protein [Cyanobacterium aponinum]|uniref:Uncharacterized protein n=1 Tax=Cyanobacterium aponinum 0216 TaxID=2676140 RepID=A0A844GPK0_9CHRO|nr:hypothetical protein [Cyanobacterium aponinum]MTF37493.1 hypothetical protein [Cyanobacterium aponinum 0216]
METKYNNKDDIEAGNTPPVLLKLYLIENICNNAHNIAITRVMFFANSI